MKKKGFSLVELLAVIIILGVLMLIAIPSVTNYINNSRKEVYVNTGKELIKGASHLVTKGKIDIDDTNTTYYIPYTCIDMDKDKARSPYGEFEEAYVVVTVNEDKSYDYYFYSRDTEGIGIYPITEEAALSAECIRTGVDALSTNLGIGNRKNIKVYNSDCSKILNEKKATQKNPKVDEHGNIIDKNAVFETGKTVNKKMKKLAGNTNFNDYNQDTKIKHIVFSEDEPGEENKTSNNIVSTSNSEVPIYMWFEEDTIYLWSQDEIPALNANSSYLFRYLSSLEDIECFSDFDTSKVTDFSYFFDNSGIRYIDLSNIDTSKATNMAYMFYACNELNSIDLSMFDTSKVTNMDDMFAGLYKITSIDLSTFDTSNVTNMKSMFTGCKELTYLDVSMFDTSKVTNMYDMFYACYKVQEFDTSNFDTSKVTNMGGMFGECYGLTSIDLTHFDTSSLISLGTNGFSYGYTSYSTGMFNYSYNLETINISNWDVSHVKGMAGLFSRCYKLKNIDLSRWNTASLVDMYEMFYSCTSLESINLSSFNTSNVTTMHGLFRDCDSLTQLDLSSFNTSKTKEISFMFYNCKKLVNVNLSSFDTRKVKEMQDMFYNCQKIETLDLSSFSTPAAEKMGDMFAYCTSLKSLNISNMVTSNVTYMFGMFKWCSSLKEIDISSFDTSKVQNFGYMFYFCGELETIYVSENFNYDSCMNKSGILQNCPKIKGGQGTTWNSSMGDISNYAHIDEGPTNPGLFTLKV